MIGFLGRLLQDPDAAQAAAEAAEIHTEERLQWQNMPELWVVGLVIAPLVLAFAWWSYGGLSRIEPKYRVMWYPGQRSSRDSYHFHRLRLAERANPNVPLLIRSDYDVAAMEPIVDVIAAPERAGQSVVLRTPDGVARGELALDSDGRATARPEHISAGFRRGGRRRRSPAR